MHDRCASAAAGCCGHHREDISHVEQVRLGRNTPKISVVVALLLGVAISPILQRPWIGCSIRPQHDRRPREAVSQRSKIARPHARAAARACGSDGAVKTAASASTPSAPAPVTAADTQSAAPSPTPRAQTAPAQTAPADSSPCSRRRASHRRPRTPRRRPPPLRPRRRRRSQARRPPPPRPPGRASPRPPAGQEGAAVPRLWRPVAARRRAVMQQGGDASRLSSHRSLVLSSPGLIGLSRTLRPQLLPGCHSVFH